MNGETWTEYAVRFGRGLTIKCDDREDAERLNRDNYNRGTVVGRTVTATPWLPVQDQP